MGITRDSRVTRCSLCGLPVLPHRGRKPCDACLWRQARNRVCVLNIRDGLLRFIGWASWGFMLVVAWKLLRGL